MEIIKEWRGLSSDGKTFTNRRYRIVADRDNGRFTVEVSHGKDALGVRAWGAAEQPDALKSLVAALVKES